MADTARESTNSCRSFFGSRDEPTCKLHASETNGFLHLCAAALRARGHVLGGRQATWQEALDPLVSIIGLIKRFPRVFPTAHAQSFKDLVCRHLQVCELLGVAYKPKHHRLLEMAMRIPSHGSPGWVACWTDEASNLNLKRLWAATHAVHWQARILVNWSSLKGSKRHREEDL